MHVCVSMSLSVCMPIGGTYMGARVSIWVSIRYVYVCVYMYMDLSV